MVDKSSNANNANSVTAGTYLASAINGQPGVTFDGTTMSYTISNGINLETALTIFAVLKTSSNIKGPIISGATGAFDYNTSENAGTYQQGADISNTGNLGHGNLAQTSSAVQMNVTYNAASLIFRIGSAVDGTTSISTAVTATETTIGYDAGGGNYLPAVLCELIIYNTVQTLANIELVESYLNTRYAV